ncbi:Espin-like protein [Geodia barretti]|uniref:Espin-like protein n=1 Tax=Geodia barretti TaxID=519541 RepID=A0AA35WUJ3_GEOBA|nr:Espin-like protein [Geodia barretti]
MSTDRSIRSKDGCTSFHYSANNTEILRQLLASHSTHHNINAPSSRGETPLHLACLNGNLESAKLLVGSGADMKVRDRKGNSVLHLSAASGSIQLIRWINSSFKDFLNSHNKDGDTPSHCAARLGCREALSTLTDLGADMGMKNKWNHTPLEEFHQFNYRTTTGIRRELGLTHVREGKGENCHVPTAVVDGDMRESRSHSEPRLPRNKMKGREGGEESRSATDVTADIAELYKGINGTRGGRVQRAASPLSSSSLSCARSQSPSQSKNDDTGNAAPCKNSATASNHASADSQEKTHLGSKSASHLDRRPVNRDDGVHCTGSSKSATNVITDAAAGGTPVSEHREMRRKEKYNISSKTGVEELRVKGKSSSQSEKLQRRRDNVRSESAASGIRRPYTPDLGMRGRAKSEVQHRNESLV